MNVYENIENIVFLIHCLFIIIYKKDIVIKY